MKKLSKEFYRKVVNCYNSNIVITDADYPSDIDGDNFIEAGYSMIEGVTRKILINGDYVGRNEIKTICYLDKYGKTQVIQGFHLQRFVKSKIATPKRLNDDALYVGYKGISAEYPTLQVLKSRIGKLFTEDHLCISFGNELFILDLESYKEEDRIQVISPYDEVETIAGSIRLNRYFIFTDINNQDSFSKKMKLIDWN